MLAWGLAVAQQDPQTPQGIEVKAVKPWNWLVGFWSGIGPGGFSLEGRLEPNLVGGVMLSTAPAIAGKLKYYFGSEGVLDPYFLGQLFYSWYGPTPDPSYYIVVGLGNDLCLGDCRTALLALGIEAGVAFPAGQLNYAGLRFLLSVGYNFRFNLP